MEPFTRLAGVVAPLDRANVDTDAIIPKQYLKSVKRTGFGPNLFDDWRYLDSGEAGQDHGARRLNPDFVLNQPRYRDAQILLARKNFGCGSSREHAVWALLDAGFRAVIAPSFADIFFSNSCKNGLLPIVMDDAAIDRLFGAVAGMNGLKLRIDLEDQTVEMPDGRLASFDIDASHKHRLLHGLDDIALTLRHADAIRDYESRHRATAPWLF
ncbi:MAG: 3-isopropylmalate dehydratase small subunit [Gammaproteobacteria bacterium]|nr:3-isopropylmalate dehydratase small subunit [Gammaproteobacteria bacterium]